MSDVDTSGRRRKTWPDALKREIVAATLLPRASVSIVARQYDVNANQVFAWRRRFRSSAEVVTPALVPVTITPESEDKAPPAEPAHSDTIEIEVGGDCRVRVGSSFDGRALKRVLDVLRKR